MSLQPLDLSSSFRINVYKLRFSDSTFRTVATLFRGHIIDYD